MQNEILEESKMFSQPDNQEDFNAEELLETKGEMQMKLLKGSQELPSTPTLYLQSNYNIQLEQFEVNSMEVLFQEDKVENRSVAV